MSYGLKVQSFDSGGNVITQIDTEIGLVNFVVTNEGTGSRVNLGGDRFDGVQRLVFIKPRPSQTDNVETKNIAILSSSKNTSQLIFVTNFEGNTYETSYDEEIVDYIVLEDVTGVAPVGDYGLQVLTAGQETSFDSRMIQSDVRFQIDTVIPSKSLGGYGESSTDLITNDPNKYIEVYNWSFWQNPTLYVGLNVKSSYTTYNVYHKDIAQEEPNPTLPPAPLYVNDNYAPIMLGQ